ncbi:MAG: phytase [Phaeodactylibacter sp.]|nr:phytase [Phaeodactylibacter sp.]MCB9297578.1 phytase [Lewinellaceae bacterium]
MEPKHLFQAIFPSALLFSCRPEAFIVYPAFETDPVASPDDAADDTAIFIHPGDASKNAIIGTDKQKGLIVYDAQGKAVHRYPFGRISNVDLRQEVDWNGRRVTIVGGSNRPDQATGILCLVDEGGAAAEV